MKVLSEVEVGASPTLHTIPRSVAVVSGKGGVGKTNLVANLAVAAARAGKRVLVVDGDVSLANVDILLGLLPSSHVADVLEGKVSIEDAIVQGPHGIDLLPAASGRPELASLTGHGLASLVDCIGSAVRRHELVLVDAGAGIGSTVMGLADACERVVVVTTPEPTSLADAYATIKVLTRARPARTLEVLVNHTRDPREGYETFSHLHRLTQRFLDVDLAHLGVLPRDSRVNEAVQQQKAVVELFPGASVSRGISLLADALCRGVRPEVMVAKQRRRLWRRMGPER